MTGPWHFSLLHPAHFHLTVTALALAVIPIRWRALLSLKGEGRKKKGPKEKKQKTVRLSKILSNFGGLAGCCSVRRSSPHHTQFRSHKTQQQQQRFARVVVSKLWLEIAGKKRNLSSEQFRKISSRRLVSWLRVPAVNSTPKLVTGKKILRKRFYNECAEQCKVGDIQLFDGESNWLEKILDQIGLIFRSVLPLFRTTLARHATPVCFLLAAGDFGVGFSSWKDAIFLSIFSGCNKTWRFGCVLGWSLEYLNLLNLLK